MADERYRVAWERALEITDRNARKLVGFPHTTQEGRWRTSQEGRWTGGFWVGLLWLAYAGTGEERWRREALAWCERLRPRQHDRTTHDMGFLFEPSFILGYRLTGDESLRDSAVTAARSLATRYHPKGEFIQAWEVSEDPRHAGRTIVDTVMNLPLLIWAAEAAGEPRLREIALAVADTTARYHVRDDGSSYHVVDFNTGTGEPVFRGTWQGLADESCWSRGQAWALHGFARMARLTGSAAYAEMAARLAGYFLSHLPEDGVPYWDFQVPMDAGEPRDASAGAIAAAGFLQLAAVRADAEGARYRSEAERLMGSLIDRCLSPGYGEQQGIILHCTMDRPRGSAVDESLIFGDYYFAEALFQLLFPDREDPGNPAG